MELTSRKKRPLNRNIHLRDTTLCIISLEGAVTEGVYFELFTDPTKPTFNQRVQVIPLIDKTDNISCPTELLQRLDDYKKENYCIESDQFWLVCDFDHWQDHGKLQEAFTKCKQKNYSMAVSYPNFEIWLYFHFSSDISNIIKLSVGDQKKAIKEELSKFFEKRYKKNNFNAEALIPNIQSAITNSQKCDNPPTNTWHTTTGTTVYRLVSWITNRKILSNGKK